MTLQDEVRRSRLQREAEGYLELGMPKQAIAALARLGDPADYQPQSLYLLGEGLRELQRYREALLPLQRAADATPGNLAVWFALAWCHKRTDRIDLAIDAMEKALAAEPKAALAHYNLACYLSLAGEEPRALECLARALEIEPDFRGMIDDEPDFDPIRDNPRFQALRHEDRA